MTKHEPSSGTSATFLRPPVELLGFRSLTRLVTDVVDQYEDRLQQPKRLLGLSTGYTRLDEITYGLQKGQLFVIAGQISAGKTSLAMSIAEHVAVDCGIPCAAIFPETNAPDFVLRMVGSRSGFFLKDCYGGRLSFANKANLAGASRDIQLAPLFLGETGLLDIFELAAKARQLTAHCNVRLLVIDGLRQLAFGSRRHGVKGGCQMRFEELSVELKALAVELNVPILVTAHLNEEAPSGVGCQPGLHDLGAALPLAQDADIVGLLSWASDIGNQAPFSSEMTQTPAEDPALLTIVKNRDGEIGDVPLRFVDRHARFVDPEASDSRHLHDSHQPDMR